jgi:mono/diheme cytochrome c family protein
MFSILRIIVSKKHDLQPLTPLTNQQWQTLSLEENILQRGGLQYKLRCYKCHGLTGGGTYKGANLVDDEWKFGHSYHAIYNVLYYGAGEMKNYGKKMTLEDLQAITVYVKQLHKTQQMGQNHPSHQDKTDQK